jgi:hypothetical protein
MVCSSPRWSNDFAVRMVDILNYGCALNVAIGLCSKVRLFEALDVADAPVTQKNLRNCQGSMLVLFESGWALSCPVILSTWFKWTGMRNVSIFPNQGLRNTCVSGADSTTRACIAKRYLYWEAATMFLHLMQSMICANPNRF